jgi:hypothetical protein
MVDYFPRRLLLATFGGWVNRRQAHAIEYQIEENRVFRELQGNKRPRLALVRESKTGKAEATSPQSHIRTVYEAGIPSSVIRLRMLHASRASTACASASRACSRSPRILL